MNTPPMNTPRPVRGIELRYLLTALLLDAGVMTIDEMVKSLEDAPASNYAGVPRKSHPMHCAGRSAASCDWAAVGIDAV